MRMNLAGHVVCMEEMRNAYNSSVKNSFEILAKIGG
jgi:hypothetical protein